MLGNDLDGGKKGRSNVASFVNGKEDSCSRSFVTKKPLPCRRIVVVSRPEYLFKTPTEGRRRLLRQMTRRKLSIGELACWQISLALFGPLNYFVHVS